MKSNSLFKKVFRKIDTWYFKRNLINQNRLNGYLSAFQNKSNLTRPDLISTIAIVVPCYNHLKFIELALQSIILQSRKPNEIILMDDFSIDQTPERITEFYNKYSKTFNIIIQRNEKNIGQSESINLGISIAKSELIMILNDDDYLMHDAVEKTIHYFNQEKNIFLLGSKAVYIYNNEYLINHKKKIFDSLNDDKLVMRKSYPENVTTFTSGREIDMCHSASSFLKVAWEAVGGYYSDKNKRVIIYSDRDFQLRVNSIFPIGILDDAAFAFWRINSSVDGGLFS
jgi:GT2 family glycosyltransferase